MADCFIEIMNGATAHHEFSDLPAATALLREGLAEALTYKEEPKHAAMIAGNLASMLIKEKNPENSAEIERCFLIEETYFRKSGYHRDLEISLVNQCIYYAGNEAPLSVWEKKLEEARKIANENGLEEFATTLSKLEWHAMRIRGSGKSGEEWS